MQSLALPPRVLEEQPLTLLMKQIREPPLQPGSLGGTSIGVGSLVALVSTASEQVPLEPIMSPDDADMVSVIDAILLNSSCSHWLVCIVTGQSYVLWTSRRPTPIVLLACTTSPVDSADYYLKTQGEGNMSTCHSKFRIKDMQSIGYCL